jgi:hypothetical protein
MFTKHDDKRNKQHSEPLNRAKAMLQIFNKQYGYPITTNKDNTAVHIAK